MGNIRPSSRYRGTERGPSIMTSTDWGETPLMVGIIIQLWSPGPRPWPILGRRGPWDVSMRKRKWAKQLRFPMTASRRRKGLRFSSQNWRCFCWKKANTTCRFRLWYNGWECAIFYTQCNMYPPLLISTVKYYLTNRKFRSIRQEGSSKWNLLHPVISPYLEYNWFLFWLSLIFLGNRIFDVEITQDFLDIQLEIHPWELEAEEEAFSVV